ncbi:MAG: ribokinase [Anaerolineaceae bacterium]
MVDIVVVGSLNMDLVVRVNQMPVPGETVSGGDLNMICGGKGANQAVAAGRIAGEAAMIGRVGNDSFGQRLLDNLKASHVNTDHVCKGETVTGTAVILVDEHGENSIVISPGENGKVTIDDLEKADAILRDARFVLAQFELPVNVVEALIQKVVHLPAKLILNPAPFRAISQELLSKVDFLIPNEIEAEKLTGIKIDNVENAKKAAQVLLDWGVQQVIITMGVNGALLADLKGIHLIPAYLVSPVDTTASGDTFIGGFTAALTRDFSLEDAIKYGNAAAAIAVTRFGAQTSIPTREEVDQFYLSKELPENL